jgi:hypothetical protein
MTLTYDFVERARAQLLGKRGRGLALSEEIIH